MKKRTFIILFICMNLFFIIFQIHKNSKIIKLSYQKQKKEKEKNTLLVQKNELQQQLYVLQNRSTIKQYAQETLKMKKIKLKQIKILASNE